MRPQCDYLSCSFNADLTLPQAFFRKKEFFFCSETHLSQCGLRLERVFPSSDLQSNQAKVTFSVHINQPDKKHEDFKFYLSTSNKMVFNPLPQNNLEKELFLLVSAPNNYLGSQVLDMIKTEDVSHIDIEVNLNKTGHIESFALKKKLKQ